MNSPQQNPENPSSLPVRRVAQDDPHTELALPLGKANFGTVPVVSIQPGALGRVLTRDSSSAATDVLRDGEFLQLLAKQVAYREAVPEQAVAKVINDIRVVTLAGEPGTVRAAAKALKWAVSDLTEEIRSFKPREDASESEAQKKTVCMKEALVKTALHSATILNMIQDAAASLADRPLWDTFSSFLDASSPTIAMKLKELESEDTKTVKRAAESLFGDIMECASRVLRGADPMRALLIGNLVLKRLVHLVEARNLRASGQDALEIQDTLAILFSRALAQEVNSESAEDRPLCSLLNSSQDSALRLFESVATNFSKLGPDDFPQPADLLRPIERDRNNKCKLKVEAAQAMMSCACSLWPAEYSELLRRRVQGAGVEHRLIYLQALEHGIAENLERAKFVVAEYLILLQEPAKGSQTRRMQEMHRQAQALLKDLAPALVEYLREGRPNRFEKLPGTLRQDVLWEILVPACSSNKLGKEGRLAVLSFFEYEVRQRGPKLFTRAGVDQLLSPELIASLDPAQKSTLLTPIFDSFTSAFSEEKASKHDEDLLGNPALVRKYKPLLAAFGSEGLVYGLKEAAAKRDRHPFEAITLIRLIGESAREVSIAPASQADIEEAVGGILIPLFCCYAELGSGRSIPRAQEENVLPEEPEAEADPDSLIHQALFEREDAEDDKPAPPMISVESPHFVSLATALCGQALREFAAQPAIQAGVTSLILEKLGNTGMQSVLTKYYAAVLSGKPLGQMEDDLAEALHEDSLTNADLRAALGALRKLIRKQPSLWPVPLESRLYKEVAHKLAEKRSAGFVYSPGADAGSGWDSRACDDALCLLTDYHARLPGEAREHVEVEIFKSIRTWAKRRPGVPRLVLSDSVALGCAQRVLQQHAHPEVKAYIALFVTEALEAELLRGSSSSRRAAFLRSEASPFVEEALKQIGEADRVKRSRDDAHGELLRPRLLTLWEKLKRELGGSDVPVPPKRTVEDTSIPKMGRRGPTDNPRRLLE